jgi:hypothetical protein
LGGRKHKVYREAFDPRLFLRNLFSPVPGPADLKKTGRMRQEGNE